MKSLGTDLNSGDFERNVIITKLSESVKFCDVKSRIDCEFADL